MALRVLPDLWVSLIKTELIQGISINRNITLNTPKHQTAHASIKPQGFQRHIEMSINAWGQGHPWPQTHRLTPTDSINDNYLGDFATDVLLMYPDEDVLHCKTGDAKNAVNTHGLIKGQECGRGGRERVKCLFMCALFQTQHSSVCSRCPSRNPRCTETRRQTFLASFVLSSHTPWGFFWQPKSLAISYRGEVCLALHQNNPALMCRVLWKTSLALAALKGGNNVTARSDGCKAELLK